jgi:hypothetical protein
MSWKRFFRRKKWDEERSRELDVHLQIEADENLARGMSAFFSPAQTRQHYANS